MSSLDALDQATELSFVQLHHKPQTKLAWNLHAQKDAGPENMLVVFVNGLGLPMAAWSRTVQTLLASNSSLTMLTYDRYGQGQSQPDPVGLHSLQDATQDLNHFLTEILATRFTSRPRIVLVSHSIGVPLVRVFFESYRPEIAAVLMLDSNIANTDFVSIFPDPDAASFYSVDLPENTDLEMLRSTRAKAGMMFAPAAPNKEQLDRRNIPQSLPSSSAPMLTGSPYLTVVGHDPEAFADENVKHGFTSKGLSLKYISPFWDNYNVGLKRLTMEDRVRGVVIAKGASHFIQRDRPDLVAQEVLGLVEVVRGGDVQSWQAKELYH